MICSSALVGIARKQDAKIRAYLEGGGPVEFWYADCRMEGAEEERMCRLHALGFDNYPVAHIPAIDALSSHLFFFERVLGADITSTHGNNGYLFDSWCQPFIDGPDAIFSMNARLDASPIWQVYEAAIAAYLHDTPKEDVLPLAFPGVCPLDIACNVCGPEAFFLLLYEEPEAAEHLLDAIVTLAAQARERIETLGVRVVSSYGFPGVYCNDLRLPSLSPSHVMRFVLPRYSRLAEECGGLVMALNSPDVDVLRSAMSINGLAGCLFDKTLSLSTIREYLGDKLFAIHNYCYDDALDRPTLRDGIWWNPIVQSYSRELEEVYREMDARTSMMVTIERPSLEEVCAVRQALQSAL